MTGDAELLLRYVRDRDEAALAEFARRHLDLLYASALRRTGGNDALARDVAQHVLVAAARRAAALATHPTPVAWLHATGRNAAANALRAESRRRRREGETVRMSALHESNPPDWDRLRPVLDAALDELGGADREAVLLRYFENRSFAEIGLRLHLAENAARMRVERALDRLRVRLARRGITSTSGALGVALASEASAAAPAGLLEAAVGAAVSAPAVGGGLAASGLALMSMFKLAGQVGVLAAVFGVSLAFNGYFLFRDRPREPAASKAESAIRRSSIVPMRDGPTTAAVVGSDPVQVRDELRAAGASDAVVRAVLEGLLLRRYRETLSQRRAERHAAGWWRDPARLEIKSESPQTAPTDAVLFKELVAVPLEALLGPDPRDLAEAQARYAFLPEELRLAFGRLDRDKVPTATRSGDLQADVKAVADANAAGEVAARERAALIDSLAPELRAEYDLRFGSTGMAVARQLAPLGLSEQEFREIYPLADEYAKAVAAAPYTPSVRTDLAVGLIEKLVDTYGPDRASGFIWAASQEYTVYARVATEGNLPRAATGRVMTLINETAGRAVAIHADGTLSLEAKKAALVELQAAARQQFDAVFPVEAQQRLPSSALGWLEGLGQGRYQFVVPTLPGPSFSTFSLPVELTAPAPVAGAFPVNQAIRRLYRSE